ncbi:GTP-binding protein HflX [Anaerovibrio sp. JC8]|uniref:GTPase HflX n=1 Tax=Anaerovibrio sp. JC8 TaxID=1240085 RepID=UPI000A0D8026|nr:GTPase HflX [Anaerovibrio sp. JC8]ORT98978.1 GTP-binding protein HflX [Anaerovibrio sp. JC8]
MVVNGKLDNIKAGVIQELEALYELEIPQGQIITREAAEKMLELTDILGREVAVYINRKGTVVQVSVGDDATVELPDIKQRSTIRLSGVRCVHTHPSADTRLSAPDLSSLRSMRFDCMVAIGRKKDGKIHGSLAFLNGEMTEEGGYVVSGTKELPLKELNNIDLVQLIVLVNNALGKNRLKDTEEQIEKAILAGVAFSSRRDDWQVEDSLAELRGLVETAGAEIVGEVIQNKDKPDNAYFLGKGKVEEIAMLAQNVEADLLVIDDEISPSQQRNLELSTGLRVVDRTALILDIFAQRARSSAGKLQVELAQLKYNLPRLGGQGLVMSRLGGGIGTRGPGETKLEMDRRRIHGRIHDLEEQLKKLKNQRKLHRNQRKQSRLASAALVGYTNAGKSTILNALSDSDVLAEDKLFATLDPTTRLVDLDEKQQILLTDTVGFIQKLPHTLVSAFQATLEETTEADLLVHVVDASDPNYELQIKAVIKVLEEIGAKEKPAIFVFNKADRLMEQGGNGFDAQRMLQGRDGVVISARKPEDLQTLREKLSSFFNQGKVVLKLCIPYTEGSQITRLHELGTVLSTDYNEQGTVLEVELPVTDAEPYMQYEIKE